MNWKLLNKKVVDNKEDILSILYKNRGLKSQKEIDKFLNPLDPLKISPKDLKIKDREIKIAIKRIKTAIKNNDPIFIYGDYDADGVTATAVLWEVLFKLKAKVMPYIPSRVEEGYGLSEKGIDNLSKQLINNNKPLIITVDNGIVAKNAVSYATKRGFDVIITDHHVKPSELPKALAIIHTIDLSGSGVAWLFAKEIIKSFKSKLDPLDYLNLVTIGSIADLVPLTNFNRTIIKAGLKKLNTSKRIGLLELIKESGLEQGALGTYEVGFMIAPRLNAMGRLESALDSLRLLCTNNQHRAKELAKKLGLTNKERQELTLQTTIHAKNLGSEINRGKNLIFVTDESYNQGVIGLVAGKLVEEYYLPAVVISKGKEISKASVRSVNGFNIIEAIRSCSDLLIDCGGHPMAAGFTIETKNIEKFRIKLENLTKKLKKEQLEKELKIDCQINLSSISLSLYEEISKMQPFGIGNPEPIFLSQARIIDMRLVGRDQKHIKLKLDDPKTHKKENYQGNLFIDGIGFNLANKVTKVTTGDLIDITYSITLDSWNGNNKVQLKIKDALLAGSSTLNNF